MKIQLTDVRGQSRDFRLEEALTLEGFDDRVSAGRVRVDVHVNPAGERWYLNADVLGDFSFQCDRCGVEYQDKLEGEFSLVILSRAVRGLEEDEDEDVVLLPVQSPELDLTNQVRESMVLAAPMQFLCCEDCPGLDPDSGKKLDSESPDDVVVDPRWGALMDLKAKMESEGDSASDERQE